MNDVVYEIDGVKVEVVSVNNDIIAIADKLVEYFFEQVINDYEGTFSVKCSDIL